ncbi:MAG: TIGR04283 family arsenosugar biosynthesis glycosyltransferase [Planctomycetales bacterium]
MKVSIIIPTLNEAETIERSVRRAWATGPSEVIVVDGESEDDTPEIARRGASLVLQGERGRAKQQNLGASRAKGDVFLFLHADNWLDPRAVEQALAALRDSSVQVGAFWQHVEADGWLYRLLEQGNAYRVARWGLAYGDQGLFIRRSLFEEVGGFPELGLMEDLYLLMGLRDRTRPVLLPGPIHVSSRRWKRHGVVGQTARNWLLLLAARCGVDPNSLARFYVPHSAP